MDRSGLKINWRDEKCLRLAGPLTEDRTWEPQKLWMDESACIIIMLVAEHTIMMNVMPCETEQTHTLHVLAWKGDIIPNAPILMRHPLRPVRDHVCAFGYIWQSKQRNRVERDNRAEGP